MTAAFLRDDYEDFVCKLAKPAVDIVTELTPQQAGLWHAATGVATEAGELLDAAKRWCIYQKALDVDNVIEELGDIEFYTAMVRTSIGVTREEVLRHNREKLSERYGEKYSNEAAIARADKE